MTDFEQRIGPRGSPSPETQPIYTHKTWTRPGFKMTPPKKPRAQRQPMERTPRFSRSDGDTTLLLRMHIVSYLSKSRHTYRSGPS